jgi:hypothetical protein
MPQDPETKDAPSPPERKAGAEEEAANDPVPEDERPAGSDEPEEALEAEASEAPKEPPRRKKKKKKPAPIEAEADDIARDEAPAGGPAAIRLPAFAAAYPPDPELDRLVAAFARGDHRMVREKAPALAERTDDPEVRKAARDLRARLDPDPLALWMLAGSGALLLFLAVWFYSHRH